MAIELKFKGENAVVGTTVSEDGRTLVIGVKGFAPMELSLGDPRLHATVKAAAMINGFRQRLMDAAAIKRNGANGASATPAEKDAAIRRLFDHYMSGADQWELERGAPTGPRIDPIIVAALCEAFGKPEDIVRAMIETKAAEKGLKPAEYCAAMGELGKVKPIVERMRAEALKAANVVVSEDDWEDAGEEDEPAAE